MTEAVAKLDSGECSGPVLRKCDLERMVSRLAAEIDRQVLSALLPEPGGFVYSSESPK